MPESGLAKICDAHQPMARFTARKSCIPRRRLFQRVLSPDAAYSRMPVRMTCIVLIIEELGGTWSAIFSS